jgi:hypothetical protein
MESRSRVVGVQIGCNYGGIDEIQMRVKTIFLLSSSLGKIRSIAASITTTVAPSPWQNYGDTVSCGSFARCEWLERSDIVNGRPCPIGSLRREGGITGTTMNLGCDFAQAVACFLDSKYPSITTALRSSAV